MRRLFLVVLSLFALNLINAKEQFVITDSPEEIQKFLDFGYTIKHQNVVITPIISGGGNSYGFSIETKSVITTYIITFICPSDEQIELFKKGIERERIMKINIYRKSKNMPPLPIPE